MRDCTALATRSASVGEMEIESPSRRLKKQILSVLHVSLDHRRSRGDPIPAKDSRKSPSNTDISMRGQSHSKGRHGGMPRWRNPPTSYRRSTSWPRRRGRTPAHGIVGQAAAGRRFPPTGAGRPGARSRHPRRGHGSALGIACGGGHRRVRL